MNKKQLKRQITGLTIALNAEKLSNQHMENDREEIERFYRETNEKSVGELMGLLHEKDVIITYLENKINEMEE